MRKDEPRKLQRRRKRRKPVSFYSNHNTPWPKDELTKAALQSLVNWYTLDDIAQLMGRTPEAIRNKLRQFGMQLWWRCNHKGVARIWQRRERETLYSLCDSVTAKEAAHQFGCSLNALRLRCRLSGIRWNQGYVNLTSISRLTGCSFKTVARTAREVLPASIVSGRKRGSRYRLTLEQAEQVVKVLRPGRVPYMHRLFE